MVNVGPLPAEIDPVVWGTPANFKGFRALAALLHGTRVLGVSHTLRHWTEGVTYIRQGGHHVGHWPTFLVSFIFFLFRCFKEQTWGDNADIRVDKFALGSRDDEQFFQVAF